MLGMLRPLQTGARISGLGYLNLGGTLNVAGLLFLNRCSWAHCLSETARLLEIPREHLLTADECRALDGRLSPHGVIIPEVGYEEPQRDRAGPTP
ncbi:MAG: hypothetical protein C4293_22415 [Nitrospiraceae bacterium]